MTDNEKKRRTDLLEANRQRELEPDETSSTEGCAQREDKEGAPLTVPAPLTDEHPGPLNTLLQIAEFMESSSNQQQVSVDEWDYASKFDYELSHAASEIRSIVAELRDAAEAAPAPQQSELSDERIAEIYRAEFNGMPGAARQAPQNVPALVIEFARAIEREVANKAAPAAPVQTAEPVAWRITTLAPQGRSPMVFIKSDEYLARSTHESFKGSKLEPLYLAAPALPAQAEQVEAVRAAEINMNERFSVTLTKFGAQVRNDHYAWMREKYPEAAPALSKEGDVLNEQLWELMKIFGVSIHLGMSEVPFKGNKLCALATKEAAAQVPAEKGGAA